MRPDFGFVYSMLEAYSPPAWATLVAGFFVLVSLSLSIYLIFEHLSAYNNPEEQKFLLGVILMVPCYAIESYVSLVNPSLSVDCGILREGYEALAMYCFGRYLTACLGGEENAVAYFKREGGTAGSDSEKSLLHDEQSISHQDSEKGVLHHHFPMNYILKPWRVDEKFYRTVRFGIFQYMIIKTMTATSSVFLEAFGAYCDGEFKWQCGYPYMTVILNFSQYWALYCLVEFYTATKEALAHIHPLAKFLMFKSIVFLTWWQGVIIAIMSTLGLLRSPIAQGLQFRTSIQDFIICIEMGVASVCHLYVFPAKPYEVVSNQLPRKNEILEDYVSSVTVDPDEIRDIIRPAKLRLPQPVPDEKSATSIRASVKDFVIGGSEYVIKDFHFAVDQAKIPVEKGFNEFNSQIRKISKNIKPHDKRSQDDIGVNMHSPDRIIRGIDDPLLSGSISDTGASKVRRQHRRESSISGGDSIGSRSTRFLDGYELHGDRWVMKK